MPVITVAILGAGALGHAMAVRLDTQGLSVRVWNRTTSKAAAVADERADITVAGGVTEAVRDADVVLTVLRDEAAVAAVADDLLSGVRPDAVWVQASTIGPSAAGRLAARAAAAGVAYVDAPVSGSTGPARAGTLVWLVSGADDAVARARPVLDALGGSVHALGTAGSEGSAAKLVVNAWMASAVAAASDALALADSLGVDHAALREVLGAGALAMPYALAKMEAMDSGAVEPGFAVGLALKDLRLAGADGRVPSPVLDAVTRRFDEAVAAGWQGLDVAALHRLHGAGTSTPGDARPS
ncbi:NAD(P)-dependent oxidoreductase [uncultured Cellulomonas sp.]|uniref:NAD(P)-dependent oxidoreductase n=1 Tax=uncultured Cellulomonas sp. TaxID=189682 RepID=UPI00262F03E8|nr:NAD(P)-binding domain-containing protein [uncultured Cellulomonas sp.]